MHSKCLDFFSIFPLFPICSLQVRNRFSTFSLSSQCVLQGRSQCVLQGRSQYYRALIPYVLPKSSPSHLYRWAKGGGTPSFHRIFLFWGASIVSIFFFCDGPIKLVHCTQKKKSWTYEWLRRRKIFECDVSKFNFLKWHGEDYDGGGTFFRCEL